MKTRFKKQLVTLLVLALTLTTLIGCGSSDSTGSSKSKSKGVITETHKILVGNTELEVNEVTGYKAYALVFSNTKGYTVSKPSVYFKNTIKDLDTAKSEGLVYDYSTYSDDGILLLYVDETLSNNPLMPGPDSGSLRLDFEDSLDTYNTWWAEACTSKLGAGASYRTIDLNPSEDFGDGDFICVKRVVIESYFFGPEGSNFGYYFDFVDSIQSGGYTAEN
jgi:hypothetical protein